MATAAGEQMVTVRAQARFVRTSARKARVVLEHLRGKSYEQGRAFLTFNTRAVSRDILVLLESAGANAENNNELSTDELVIHECYADEGPTAKRWQPRARGRANRIRKRTCHVTVVLRHQPPAEGTKAAQRSAAQATLERSSTRRRRRAAEAAMAGTAPLDSAETPVTPDPSAPEPEAEAESVVDSAQEPTVAHSADDTAESGGLETDEEPEPMTPSTDEPAEGSRENVDEALEDAATPAAPEASGTDETLDEPTEEGRS